MTDDTSGRDLNGSTGLVERRTVLKGLLARSTYT